MKINQSLYGFTVTEKSDIKNLDATLYIMRHEKSGAMLAFLQRDDRNKTFAISFNTHPTDDTGVFHIIEHSVLCGSEKFPVKEPFVELLKGSLNTFLNAFTCEDKTVYPAASRNDKDFLNLIDVYLDAVFNPRMLGDSNIFRQEGWHYSFDENGEAYYNGVVYNEMKGAYSSPDELSATELSRALFPDTSYKYDSGGAPSAIPSLTYEMFKNAHRKHYHPSNATVFLDGAVRLDEVLPLINSYLSVYEKREIPLLIEKQKPVLPETRHISYSDDKNEEGRGRARIAIGSVFADYSDRLDYLGASVLASVIAGSNEAPIKKALLDLHLAEDIYVYNSKNTLQTFITELVGVADGAVDKAIKALEDAVRALVDEGIDKSELSATLNYVEFKLAEKDSGSLPRGVAYALSVIDAISYGENPAEALDDSKYLKELRSLIETDYFERLLERIYLSSNHKATVVLVPRTENEEAENDKANMNGFTDEEIEKFKREEAELDAAQSAPDTPEALATIPSLSLSDVDKNPEITPIKSEKYKGRPIIYPIVKSDEIIYANITFDASGLNEEELTLLSLLSSALLNLNTKYSTPRELSKKIKHHLGSFATVSAVTAGRNSASIPVIKLVASSLVREGEYIAEIAREVLTETLFENEAMLEKLLLQIRSVTEDAMRDGGDSLALGRAESHVCTYGAIQEHMLGYEAYKRIKKYITENKAALLSRLSELSRRVFTRERITVSLASSEKNLEKMKSLAKALIDIFPSGDKPEPFVYSLIDNKKEAIATPSRVAYTAFALSSERAKRYTGIMRVARTILSFGYLWENVRVRGGAYGTGFLPRRIGTLAFHSYRDPSPERSIEIYRNAPKSLRELANSGEGLTKYIIGAIGDYDTLKGPRAQAAQATANYLTGWTDEDEMRQRLEMLEVNGDSLLLAADIIDAALSEGAVCVVGGREVLSDYINRGAVLIEG